MTADPATLAIYFGAGLAISTGIGMFIEWNLARRRRLRALLRLRKADIEVWNERYWWLREATLPTAEVIEFPGYSVKVRDGAAA
jgi:hypothetical protein